jgi:hypothetical protein
MKRLISCDSLRERLASGHSRWHIVWGKGGLPAVPRFRGWNSGARYRRVLWRFLRVVHGQTARVPRVPIAQFDPLAERTFPGQNQVNIEQIIEWPFGRSGSRLQAEAEEQAHAPGMVAVVGLER